MNDPSALVSNRLTGMAEYLIAILPNLGIGLLVFLLLYVVARVAYSGVARLFARRDREDLGVILGSFVKWAIVVLALLVVSAIVFPSIKPADILAALGFGSVAIGFAFKDILQNWMAGLLILLRQPFKRGDQIKVKDFEGTVEHINSRATFIRTYDARRVVIPNADVYTTPVTVMTAFDPRRDEYDVGIGYGDDVERACRVILAALAKLDTVEKDPAPEAIPWELAESSVNIKVRWWSKPRRAEIVSTRGEVVLAIRKALAEANIDLPFPTRVVLLHDQTEEADGDRARQREGWPVGDDPPKPRHLNEVRLNRDFA
jgi:small conductance mechanosensitive channel